MEKLFAVFGMLANAGKDTIFKVAAGDEGGKRTTLFYGLKAVIIVLLSLGILLVRRQPLVHVPTLPWAVPIGGMTALLYAAHSNQNPEVATVLLGAGADVNARYKNGETVLMLASGLNRSPNIISVLIGAGADTSARDDYGQTALMYAATYNPNPKVAAVLLKAGIDVNAQDNGGMTALIDAVRASPDPEEMASLLLKAGANPKIRSREGLTAYNYSAANPKLSTDSEVYRTLEAAMR